MAESLFDKIKVLCGVADVESEEPENEVQMTVVPQVTEGSAVRRSDYIQTKDYYARPIGIANESKVVRMQNSQFKNKPVSQPIKLMVVEPNEYNDCPGLVDSLKNNRPIIINLEKMEAETAQRIFDFISGAVYAVGGSMKKVSNNIFIVAPDNVDVLAEKSDNSNARNSTGSLWHR